MNFAHCAACLGRIFIDSNRCENCDRRDSVWTAIGARLRKVFR